MKAVALLQTILALTIAASGFLLVSFVDAGNTSTLIFSIAALSVNLLMAAACISNAIDEFRTPDLASEVIR